MLTLRCTAVADLGEADWRLWCELQRTEPLLESPYFRPEFVRAVASVRTDVEVAVLERDGTTVGFFPFQRGTLHIGRPVGGKLSDYHGVIARPDLQFDAGWLVRQCGLAAWDFDHLVAQPAFDRFTTLREESPYLDLAAGYEAYCAKRREAGSDVVAKTNQKARKLAREVGPLSFEYDTADAAVFETLLTWKSAQYLRTGLADVFAYDWTRALLSTLREQSSPLLAAPLAVLRVGERPAAIGLSLESGGILHCWFVAYDPELAAYSPGQTFFLRLAEEAAARGIRKIDLGKGDERYKWSLATAGTTVWEGSVGTPSLALWLRGAWRRSRDWVSNTALREQAGLPAKLIQPVREWFAYH
jgi:CelD/BcsL family acetyltransferase involved in cellulose biosynthesis